MNQYMTINRFTLYHIETSNYLNIGKIYYRKILYQFFKFLGPC
ncbi:hypothetical protein DYY67_1994 [Candidatus Nitrosotalea sp. TS]|nr:hypothetical protein [Candidatus Nitrosotalea sp. TS]